MTTHKLKIWPPYFEAIRSQTKTFELRKNDRNFKAQDILRLEEFKPPSPAAEGAEGVYTGRVVYVRVLSVFENPAFGLQSGFCILSIRLLGTHPAALKIQMSDYEKFTLNRCALR